MSNLHGWRLEWISNATEPGMSDFEHDLRMNQLAKEEAHRIWVEHGKSVRWTQVRNGEPLAEEPAEELDPSWADW